MLGFIEILQTDVSEIGRRVVGYITGSRPAEQHYRNGVSPRSSSRSYRPVSEPDLTSEQYNTPTEPLETIGPNESLKARNSENYPKTPEDAEVPRVDGYDEPGFSSRREQKKLVRDSFRPHISTHLVNGLQGKLKQTEVEEIDYFIIQQETDIGFLEDENTALREILVENAALSKKLEEKAKQLEELAYKDPLTGLGNRRAYDAELKREVAVVNRAVYEPTPTSLTLVIVDVDNFKWFNDELGYNIGDAVLTVIGGAIGRSVHRPRDSAFRQGGDEYAALLPGTDRLHAEVVAKRILHEVEATKNRFYQSFLSQAKAAGLDQDIDIDDSVMSQIGVSIGIGTANSVEGAITPEALIDRANKDLKGGDYGKKNKGILSTDEIYKAIADAA